MTGATVRKPVEIPQLKILDNFVDMPTVVLREVPIVRVQKPVEFPQLQFLDMPVVVQRQVAIVLTVQTHLEISQLQFLDKVVDMPESLFQCTYAKFVTEQFSACALGWRTSFTNANHNASWPTQ